MGIVVVARLAARRGVRVRLRPGDDGGTTATVSVPARLFASDGPRDAPEAVRGPDAPRRPSAPVPADDDGAPGWFGGSPLAAGAPEPAPAPSGSPPAPTFVPTAAGTTATGLPQRAPGANQVPAGRPVDDETPSPRTPRPAPRPAHARSEAPRPDAPTWDRSPAAVRHRYAGVAQARARARVEQPTATPSAGIPRPAPSPAAAPEATGADPVANPVANGTTADGLPRRAPGANYVPGAAPSGTPPTGPVTDPAESGPAWDRSADAVRARFAGYQSGRDRARSSTAHPEEARPT
jgi:hypothetical protein